jgi:hypothetical protein
VTSTPVAITRLTRLRSPRRPTAWQAAPWLQLFTSHNHPRVTASAAASGEASVLAETSVSESASAWK